MQIIHLNQMWRYHIIDDETPYHSPKLEDSHWLNLAPLAKFPQLLAGQSIWLRYHFIMPPNDECSYWWLEFNQALPTSAKVWVNYEALPLPAHYSPAKWDITYAIAMDENLVTLQLRETVSIELCYTLLCVPYPCT